MNDIKQLDNIVLADVPEGAFAIQINNKHNRLSCCRPKERGRQPWFYCDLPPGTWRYIGLSTEMTEEKAREVVVRWGYRHLPIWKDYTNPNDWMPTALESFQSLLTALGCDPAGTYAVMKNELV